MPTYCAFIELQKAYDKAWRDIICKILWDCGLRGIIWRVMLKLSTDITTRVSTKFCLTRIVQIKECVREAGVLSVVGLKKMMDELERLLKELCLGAEYGLILLSALLLMDDIMLLD